jgi:hypothetical protein
MPEFNSETRKYEHLHGNETAGQPTLCAFEFCKRPIISDAYRFGKKSLSLSAQSLRMRMPISDVSDVRAQRNRP